jgi:hypothetical protein
MHNVLFSNNFAIMTAENPMHPVSMQGGNAALEKELTSKGIKFHKIKGKYGGNPENSYLIENPDHDAIIDLGKKFGQDSVIVSKNRRHKMVYTNGPDEGKYHLGNSIETFDKEPQDYFSTGVNNGKPFHFSINFDMDTKHGDEMKKSTSPYLVHFSTTSNLKELDPMYQGSAGRHSPETKHGRPEHPRVYFYEENTPTESVVTSGAKSKYIVKHPGSDKIHDIAKDAEGLQQQAKEQWIQKPTGSMQDAYFKLLKDKGYMGFKNSASALPNVVALFHKTPVHAEIPAPVDMSADKTWTEATVPNMKKSDVKEAVKEIKGPAKLNEVMKETPAGMRSKVLDALRKEKLAKMNGTGMSGAGGATPPMMQPPVPAAPAMTGLAKADESESKMAKKDLKDILEYAQALDGMVVESEDLEDWVDSKISVARQYLSDIAHYLSYEHGQPTEELDKGDVVSMKDKKVISTDTQPAPKELVAAQPKMPKIKRAPVLIQTVKMAKSEELEKGDVVNMKDKKVISTDTKAAPKTLVAKQPKEAAHERAFHSELKQIAPKTMGSATWQGPKPALVKADSKKAKFERCVMAVKKKSGDKVNPWAVCHASVDAKMEKADMSVKEHEKPTKGMPQAKQLKADADLEKIKEGAENVAKADKKKSELSKSTGYFKQNPKTQLPEWHDPLKPQREEAAREERELRPEHKMHIWAELEREHQMSQKPKAQKPKEELEKGKNYRKQREAVFGGWKSSESPLQREKKFKIINDFSKKHFGVGIEQIPQDAGYQAIREKENKLDLEKKKKIKNKQWDDQNEAAHQAEKKDLATQRKNYVQRLSAELEQQGKKIEDVLGKPNKAGIYINKPSMSNPRNNLQHTGTADSVIHELAHLIYHGRLKTSRDMDRENVQGPLPHFQQDFQRHLDEILGKIQKKYKQYGQQWRTGHENGPLAIEQVLRRMMGFPTHQKEVAKQKDGSLKPEKQFSIENPEQSIVHVVKDKEGKTKWLTGKAENIKPHMAQKISKIFRKELEYTPEEGFVQGTSPDAKINIRAREAAKDKTRKDADTLMRSEELEKKLIIGEGKPSKATIETTPEDKQKIINDLSAALDTVRVDQSPEAAKGRKMLLEHVKNKLKGRK